MVVICLDTNIVIWGIKEEATPGQEHRILQAKKLIKELKKDPNNKLILPSPVIAELLIPIAQEKRQDFLNKLAQKTLSCASFDFRCCTIFANIWEKNRSNADQFVNEKIATRQKIKIDYMIIAIAYANNAKIIYSHDPHLKTFAKGFIEVNSLDDCQKLEKQSDFSETQ